MKFAGLSLTGFLLCATVGVAHGRIRNRNLEGHVDPDCPENGYEVWQQQPNENVALKLDTVVDADTCEYQLTLSWKPDEVGSIQCSPDIADRYLFLPFWLCSHHTL